MFTHEFYLARFTQEEEEELNAAVAHLCRASSALNRGGMSGLAADLRPLIDRAERGLMSVRNYKGNCARQIEAMKPKYTIDPSREPSELGGES